MGVTLRALLVVTLLAAPLLRSQPHGIGVVAAWDEEDDVDLDFDSVGAAPVEDDMHEDDYTHIDVDDVVDEEELDLNADQEPEELIIANPGAVDAMIQATVREVSTAARESGDTDGVWPMLHARSEAESIARLASDTPRRSQSLKAALLLPGSGHAAGMLALEGAEYATALPDVQNAERASARASEAAVAASAGDGQGGAEEEGMQLLATVGEKVALTAYQVATGAVAQSGAFDHLPEDYTGDDNAGKVPYMMTSWLLAMERAELDAKAALAQPPPEFPTREDEALEEWLQEKGGVMTSVAVAPIENKAGGMRGLVATAPLQEGTVILKVPIKACLTLQTAKTIRTSGSFLGDILKPIFAENEEWGVANILLYEHLQEAHKDNSRYSPYTRTLRMYEPSRSVMRELEGTYACEFKREWEEEVEQSYRFQSQKVWHLHPAAFQRKPGRVQAGHFTREDWRWALGVVRRRAVRITRNATRRSFLALCPAVDLVAHRAGAGGSMLLGMDNHVHVTVGAAHAVGAEVGISRGNFTDAESLFKFHQVDEGWNEHNVVHVKLPGVGGHQDNIVQKVEKIRHWRTEMQLPPRAADLWRSAGSLQLYGDDEENEEGMLPGARQVEWPGVEGGVTVPDDIKPVQLYSANLFDFGEGMGTHVLATLASKTLAKGAAQLQAAVALDAIQDSNDTAVVEAIEASKNFFFYGLQPTKGLDKLDQVLIRKMELLEECGDAKSHVLTTTAVSDELLCGMRIVLANTSDVERFFDVDDIGFKTKILVEDGGFNGSLPVSINNERATLIALRDTVHSLGSWYPTSIEEDEALLALTSLGPKVRAAITTRLREKQLLQHALTLVDQLEAQFDDMDNDNTTAVTYQVERMEQRAEERRAAREAAKQQEQQREERRRLTLLPKPVAQLSVNMGGAAPVNLTVYEGDDFEAVISRFVAQYGVSQEDKEVLRRELRARVVRTDTLVAGLPLVMPDGTTQYVAVMHGEQVQAKVDAFVELWGLTEEMAAKILEALQARVQARLKRRRILEMNVAAADGRTLLFQLYDGEQHAPATLIRDFLAVWKQPLSAVNAIADAMYQRLPPPRVMVPLNMADGRTVHLRVVDGDTAQSVAEAFVDVERLADPATVVPQIVQAINHRLHPGAMQL